MWSIQHKILSPFTGIVEFDEHVVVALGPDPRFDLREHKCFALSQWSFKLAAGFLVEDRIDAHYGIAL